MSLDAIALEVAESTEAQAEFTVAASDARRQRGLLGALHAQRWPAPATRGRSARRFRLGVARSPVFGAGGGIYTDMVDANEEFSTTQPDAASLGQFAMAFLAAGAELPDSTPLYSGNTTRKCQLPVNPSVPVQARRRDLARHDRRRRPRRRRRSDSRWTRGRCRCSSMNFFQVDTRRYVVAEAGGKLWPTPGSCASSRWRTFRRSRRRANSKAGE